MKKALIDINILLDFINKREDHQSAAQIFNSCVLGQLDGYVCAHEITTLSYFLQKFQYQEEKRILILDSILNTMTTLPATKDILKEALYSPIKYYEDAVIEVSARNHDMDFIITRNQKDFIKGNIPCYTALETLVFLHDMD